MEQPQLEETEPRLPRQESEPEQPPEDAAATKEEQKESDDEGSDSENGGGDEEAQINPAAAEADAEEDEGEEAPAGGATAGGASAGAATLQPPASATEAAAAAVAIEPYTCPSRVQVHRKRANTIRICLTIEGIKPKFDLHSNFLRRPSRWTSAEVAEGDLTVRLEPESLMVQFTRRPGAIPHGCSIPKLCARIDQAKSTHEVGDGFVKVYLVRDTGDPAWAEFDLKAAENPILTLDSLKGK